MFPKVSSVFDSQTQDLLGLSRIIRSTQEVQCEPNAVGLYPHPFDCSKFLNCVHGTTYIQPCGVGTMFNPLNKACDYPHNVDCKAADRKVGSQKPRQPTAHEDAGQCDGGDSILNMNRGYTRKMFDQDTHKCFQIDCSGNQSPHPSLIRRIYYKKLIDKRFVRENRTISQSRLPSHSGELENNSRRDQKLSTSSLKRTVAKTREVSISKSIGSSNRRESAKSITNESFRQIGTQKNRERTDQNTKSDTEEFSQQRSRTRTSEHTNQNTKSSSWDVGVKTGFSAFGYSVEASVSTSGSNSQSRTSSKSQSGTAGTSHTASNSDSRSNMHTQGESASKLDQTSKANSTTATNAIITESSTNDEETIRESVDEVLTLESQELNVMYEGKIEYQIDIFEHRVINDYLLDFEVNLDVDTQAFEFRRKEGACVITANGQAFPLRNFLNIKKRFDECCGNLFQSISNDDVIEQHGAWVVRNIPATETSTNYNMKLKLHETKLNGTRSEENDFK